MKNIPLDPITRKSIGTFCRLFPTRANNAFKWLYFAGQNVDGKPLKTCLNRKLPTTLMMKFPARGAENRPPKPENYTIFKEKMGFSDGKKRETLDDRRVLPLYRRGNVGIGGKSDESGVKWPASTVNMG
jgi:hypothetical protein